MRLDDELLCDGCAKNIDLTSTFRMEEGGEQIMVGENKVKLNNADYSLCDACYNKLVEWFNLNITV